MTLHQWLLARLGTAIDYDGAYGAQCVDAVNDWLRARGEKARAASPTAAGIASERWPGCIWIDNAPSLVPARGDIVVWHANTPALGIGPAGHTAVCISGDRNALTTADQNWNLRKFLTLQEHDYRGIAGWQHIL